MSKNKVRADKTCLNCLNTNVEERFCPKCGQENIESHLSFKELFYHFIEDLTHYDNAFFKTIKYLLFHPARLTKEYLAGRRKLFVPPIKMYFFISFIAFLIPSLLPDSESENDTKSLIKTEKTTEINKSNKEEEGVSFLGSRRYKSVKELDSLQKTLPKEKRLSGIKYKLVKSIIKAKTGKTPEEYTKKFNKSFTSNLSKAIFIYLPIFGFWLWLFHNKNKWYFFDHAIFTLHYFSFLLLTLTISVSLIETLFSFLPDGSFYDTLSSINEIISCSWIIIYFYIAHNRMYREKIGVSFLKSSLLLVINISLISVIMIGLAIYSLINVD